MILSVSFCCKRQCFWLIFNRQIKFLIFNIKCLIKVCMSQMNTKQRASVSIKPVCLLPILFYCIEPPIYSVFNTVRFYRYFGVVDTYSKLTCCLYIIRHDSLSDEFDSQFDELDNVLPINSIANIIERDMCSAIDQPLPNLIQQINFILK